MAKYEPIKIKLAETMKNRPGLKNIDYAKPLIQLGYSQTSVFRWVKMIKELGNIERRIASGPAVRIATKDTINKIKKSFNHKSGCSQRSAARSLGCSQAYVSKILKKYTNIKCRKKLKRPLLTPQQRAVARPKCKRIYDNYRDNEFIIDDESYFTLNGAKQPGNDRFYSDDIEKTCDSVKYNQVQKYPPKLLVWLAISPKGTTKPWFRKSGIAINQNTYLEILKERLVPFIRRYYRSGGYVFWPDLASAHYAVKVQNYLKEMKIPVIPKDMNPANVPKARPIEDFWANLKAEVYKGDWKATTLKELENRIKLCIRRMDLKFVQNHCESIKGRIDSIRRHGLS